MNIIATSRNASLSTKSRNIQNIINEADLGSSNKPPNFNKMRHYNTQVWPQNAINPVF